MHYTPHHNIVVERMNRTLLERVHCILLNVSLSKDFWEEAISTTYYFVNQSLASAIDFKTLEAVWLGNPLDYSNLRVFGCPVYIHVDQGKLDTRPMKYILLDLISIKWT